MARMTLDDLSTQLRAAYGSQLECVVLYGSAAGREHVASKSDYNVLVLLRSIDAAALSAASAMARAWREAGNPPPMTMTMDEWQRSADVFPMEYADMLDQHRILVGESPFAGIRISRAHLRLQVESQAMGKLLRLRQGALLAGTDGKRQLELLSASFSAIMVVFRGALRLNNERPSASNADNAARVATLATFDADPFVRVAGHHRGDTVINASDAAAVLAGYLSGVEKLDAYLDTFPTEDFAP